MFSILPTENINILDNLPGTQCYGGRKREPLSPQNNFSFPHIPIFWSLLLLWLSFFSWFPSFRPSTKTAWDSILTIKPQINRELYSSVFFPFVKYWLGQTSSSRCCRGKESSKIISAYLHASWQLVIEVHVPINYIGPNFYEVGPKINLFILMRKTCFTCYYRCLHTEIGWQWMIKREEVRRHKKLR